VLETAAHQFISYSISPLFCFENAVFFYKLHAYMFVDHTVFHDIWSLKVSKTTEM